MISDRKYLPIGIHTFEQVRAGNFVYVDKTPMLYSLWNTGRVYFLSRPRRFGKSLLIDTLEQLCRGRKELFEGLWIYDKWDWETTYPVVRIDFGAGITHDKAVLESRLRLSLKECAEYYGVALQEDPNVANQLRMLLTDLERHCKQPVVVLVDEYDKPILDNFTNPEIAEVMRDGLRDIYSVLKAQQESLRLVLLTGVSKFAKVSVFSGLNNLEDISLSPMYGNICGYTQEDLQSDFVEWLDGVDLDLVKTWYNGYNFLGEKVYNPFDVLLYLKNRQFKNYWFETGTPDFLLQLMQEAHVSLPELENYYSTDELLNKFDHNNLVMEGFFFQTGYLTIKEVIDNYDGSLLFRLGYPNHEVKRSMSSLFLHTNAPRRLPNHLQMQMTRAIIEGKPELIEAPIKQFLASIPFDWYKFSKMDQYEGYWSSLIYSIFSMIGVFLQAEDTTNMGRVDLSLRWEQHLFLIEFKMDQSSKDPIEQIKERGYIEKYAEPGRRIWFVGMTFDPEIRNLSKFQWELATV